MTIRRTASTAVTLLGALAVTSQSHANPTLRVQVDQHGDFVLFGNTLGWDCATGGTPAIPAPVVGTVSNCNAAGSLTDTAPDIFWRSDAPTDGQAPANGATDANGGVSVASARSTKTPCRFL